MTNTIEDEDYDSRPVRPCMSCGQSDKAPRDQVGLADGSTAFFHMDCHAMLGCIVCLEVTNTAGGPGPKGLKNRALRDHIVLNAHKHEIFTTDDALKYAKEQN